jgi:predicted peptidase
MKCLIAFLVTLFSLTVIGQMTDNQYPVTHPSTFFRKKVLDTSDLADWKFLGKDGKVKLSDNGKYYSYAIKIPRSFSDSLFIGKVKCGCIVRFKTREIGFFSDDNKYYILPDKDSLHFVELNSKKIQSYPMVQFMIPKNNIDMIAWLEKSNKLTVFNLRTYEKKSLDNVVSFQFDNSGHYIYMITTPENTEKSHKILSRFSTLDFSITEVFKENDKNYKLLSYTPDKESSMLIYMLEQHANSKSEIFSPGMKTIWKYSFKNQKHEFLFSERDFLPAGFDLSNNIRFNATENAIVLNVQEHELKKKNLGLIPVDIWSYKDTIIQSEQLSTISLRAYVFSYSFLKKRFQQIDHDFEIIRSLISDYAIVSTNYRCSGKNFWWNTVDSTFLISIHTGKKVLVSACNFISEIKFSPKGDHIVYYDECQGNYFNYNVQTYKISNLSSILPKKLFSYALDLDGQISIDYGVPVGIAGWSANNKYCYAYSNYDIYRFSLNSEEEPVCITNNFGVKNGIKLRFLSGESEIFEDNESLILVGYHNTDKRNGFFQLNKNKDPKCLLFSNHCYDMSGKRMLTYNDHSFGNIGGMTPVKAKKSNTWIIQRQSATEAPNYFMTTDFKTLNPISNIAPQKDFLWLNSRLITFDQPDGKKSQGILYTPENLDTSKKYPVIIHYYEQLSHRLNQFPTVDMAHANINEAWFVNHGYLVFTPDLQRSFKSDDLLECYNSIMGATNAIKKIIFVDSSKIGIQGHSVAGGITNFMVTHSNAFAAALEGSGTSDLVSSGLQLAGPTLNEGSRLPAIEAMYGNIWDKSNQKKILENSPILHADKVVTPLLIFHNRYDDALPFAQGVEMFIALRRLNKPVWMLQYDGPVGMGHRVEDEAGKDYTIRMTQFFDYYLKDLPPPKWMTIGIPARLKQVESGLELDTSGRIP